jgi:hypothetical protein
MRTSRAIVSRASCLLFLLALAGCQRPQEPMEPVPPFAGSDYEPMWRPDRLWKAYETDPVKADKEYKGKIVKVADVADLSWPKRVLQDQQGRKYFPVIKYTEGKPNEWKEVIRFYLSRPENPIVEHGEDAQAAGFMGVCKGMRGGVIIVENCIVFTHFVEGPDW